MRETHTYVYRETTLTGKHDREAHEFCTGTHGSRSTGHHLVMLHANSRTGGMGQIEDHVTGRISNEVSNWSDL